MKEYNYDLALVRKNMTRRMLPMSLMTVVIVISIISLGNADLSLGARIGAIGGAVITGFITAPIAVRMRVNQAKKMSFRLYDDAIEEVKNNGNTIKLNFADINFLKAYPMGLLLKAGGKRMFIPKEIQNYQELLHSVEANTTI